MRPNADSSTELALIFQGMRDVSAGGEGEVRLKRGSGAKANFAASGRSEAGLSAGSRASQVRVHRPCCALGLWRTYLVGAFGHGVRTHAGSSTCRAPTENRRGLGNRSVPMAVRGGLKENGGRKEFQISNFKFQMRPNADLSTELALIFGDLKIFST